MCPEGLRARVDKAGKRWRGAGGADKVIGALAAPFRGDARLITLRAFTSQPPSALSNEAQLMKARNGRSWDDAVPFTAINDTLNRTMQPGDTLPVEGAAYGRVQIVIDSSGTASAPKTIGGEDRGHGLPLFGPANDEWMNWKEHGLLFKAKSNHWIIKNLQFRLYAEPTTCAEGGQTGLVFDNLRVLRAYTGFKLMDCHDTVVRNCCATRRRQQPLKGVKNHRSTQRGRSATKSECCKRLRACPEIGFAASLLAAFGKPITSGATASRLAVSTKPISGHSLKGNASSSGGGLDLSTLSKNPNRSGTWHTVADRQKVRWKGPYGWSDACYEGRLVFSYGNGKTEELLYEWHEPRDDYPARLFANRPPGTAGGVVYHFRGK